MSELKKEFREAIIVSILVIVLIISIMYTNRDKIFRKKGTAGAPQQKKASVVAGGKEPAQGSIAITRQGFDNTKDLRDPLAKPLEIALLEEKSVASRPQAPDMKGSAKPAEELVLNGIIWGGKDNLAIISGQVVGVGESVSGAKVVAITKDGVTLTRGISKIELRR